MNKKGSAMIIVVLALIAVLAGGFVWYSTKIHLATSPSTPKTVTRAPNATTDSSQGATLSNVIATSTITPNIPLDWKTYTNSNYGFKFQYPGAWIVANTTTDRAGVVWINFDTISAGTTKNSLYIKIFSDQSSFTAEEKIISSHATVTQIKVDDTKANYYPDFLDIPTVMISNHGLLIEIGEPSQTDLLGSILSTFKFIK